MAENGGGQPFDVAIGDGRVSGLACLGEGQYDTAMPLVIALHGGSYTARYFDVPGHSLLVQARDRAIPIVALDRPGYGTTTALPEGKETIASNAERLEAIIAGLLSVLGQEGKPVVLVGHSIGGAIALSLAARPASWSLAGVAISGVGLKSPPEAEGTWSTLPQTRMVTIPREIKDVVMFGQRESYVDAFPALSHQADAAVPRAELLDIVSGWPSRAPDILSRISVPVHYRMGEDDHLWVVDSQQVEFFASALSGAQSVDVELIRGTGHCIDFHRAGHLLQRHQLAFAVDVCAVKSADAGGGLQASPAGPRKVFP